jgi:small subunit ribosomal protein S9
MTATTPKKSAFAKAAADKPAAPKKAPATPKAPVARKPKAAAARAHAPAHEPKAPIVEPAVPQAQAEEATKPMAKTGHGHSFYAVGKRKSAVAQILMTEGSGAITINKLPIEGYFQTVDLRHIVAQPLTSVGVEKNINVRAKIHGGGIHAQAEALRHALSRALIQYNPESRRQLKKQGFLTRDPRVKERKKPGLKRARRAPQFSKR